MLLRASLNRTLHFNKALLGCLFILILLVILLCTLGSFIVGYKKEEKTFEVEMSAPINLYPLPFKNLRRSIERELMGVGRLQTDSNLILNPAFEQLEFSQLSVKPCGRYEAIGILVNIKSAVGNSFKRDTIRAMWANENYLKNSKIPIKYAFFVGVGQFNGSYPGALLEEIKRKRDLVLIEYIETYRNNTYKSMGMMKWAQEKCPNHEFVITLDDDVYFSITNLIKFLQRRPHNYPDGERDDPSADSKFRLAVSPNEFLYAGAIFGGLVNSPRRTEDPKYGLSWNDYPFTMFPNYASGALVIYTRKSYRYIYLAASFVKFMDIDDVYIGIVAGKLDITPTVLTQHIDCCSHWGRGSTCGTDIWGKGFNETAIGIHNLGNPEVLLQYWNQSHNDPRVLKELTSN